MMQPEKLSGEARRTRTVSFEPLACPVRAANQDYTIRQHSKFKPSYPDPLCTDSCQKGRHHSVVEVLNSQGTLLAKALY
ncbi:hypothetical protein Poly51_55650 [Rubripirellula tenax]|uniref:Uncharacterized protein n=1 Tax=Rubripirellula tenax TaxID=2528015 RepID=A0A5C6EBR8_9BACT|nr:hypothetical protein [Rubripirellula tenax]TWU46170.1 hypothetical protein Poly51_55650 [Rubripirellula tenax]